jgi:hypothetical protein
VDTYVIAVRVRATEFVRIARGVLLRAEEINVKVTLTGLAVTGLHSVLKTLAIGRWEMAVDVCSRYGE